MEQSVPTQARSVGDPALLHRVAWAVRWQSRAQSLDYAGRALELLKGDRSEAAAIRRGQVLVTLAWQAKWRGDFDAAMTHALRAEGLLSEATHPGERGQLYAILGVVYYSRQRLDLADCAVSRGLTLVGPEVDPVVHIDLLTTLATTQRYKGDFKRAGETLGRARALAAGAELARVEHNVARWMQADDAASHALTHAEAALDLAVKHQNRVILPYAHEILGACLVDLGRYDEAEAQFVKGLDMAIEDDDTRAQCQIVSWRAFLEEKRGDFPKARDFYRFGSEIAKKMTYALWEKRFSRGLADVYEALGDYENAVAAHKLAWRLEDEKRQ